MLASTSVSPAAEPSRQSGACLVDVISDHQQFLALAGEWNQAVEQAGVPHPFLRHEWMRTWWEAFGTDALPYIVVVRVDHRIAAIAPLMRESTVMYGIPIRRIRFMQNDHTPRTDVIVASHPELSYHAIWTTLAAHRDAWDVLLFSQIQHDSPTRDVFQTLADQAGFATGLWKSNDSPFLMLDGTWDTYFNGLSAKFRSNLRNRLSRATRLGEPALEILTDGAAIDAAVADAWRLEASGWKQEAGTAIACNPQVERFYTSLIETGTAAGWLRLLFLTVAGRRIATSYGACFQKRLFLFKTGYDPEYAACAPFKLLTYLAIRDAYARGLVEVDFLGDSEPWKLEWTSTARAHDWLFVFGKTPRARLLHSIKFQLGPELKRWRS
jgi:CelD/BcsL family acetyltransferase involved in cellulose biosynthesis